MAFQPDQIPPSSGGNQDSSVQVLERAVGISKEYIGRITELPELAISPEYVSPNYALELATYDDAKTIIKLLEKGFELKGEKKDKSWEERHPEYLLKEYIDDLIKNGLIYVFKDIDGKIISTFALYKEDKNGNGATRFQEDKEAKWSKFKQPHYSALYIHQYCVDPDPKYYRASKDTLPILVQFCQKNGYSAIRCDCDASSPLVDYYISLGFNIVKEVKVQVSPDKGEPYTYTAALLEYNVPNTVGMPK